MEITELMIGNLLFYMDGDTLVPVVVRKINGEDNVVCLRQSDGHKFNTMIDFLRPIPLTPDILENNGFELLAGAWYSNTKERKPIQIVFKDNTITISLNCTPVPAGIKYIHEFQNVLIVYKINKQISLP